MSDRLALLEELRQKAIQKGENGVVFFGLSAAKMELVEKVATSVPFLVASRFSDQIYSMWSH